VIIWGFAHIITIVDLFCCPFISPGQKNNEAMPKQGGQGKGKPKLKDRGFGKALIRKQSQGNQGL
jgi:hypothetical protein